MEFDSFSNNSSTTNSVETTQTANDNDSVQSSAKRRHHLMSPYYLYCIRFVEECTKNGRAFRTPRQGFAAAAIKWNTLSKEEHVQWRNQCRTERHQCVEDGTVQKLKMRNGDGGDPNCDPTELGILKDMSLKKQRDVEAIVARFSWSYPEPKDLRCQPFLLVAARPDPYKNGGFSALAVVEFTLGGSITDQFHVNFSSQHIANLIDAKYDAISRVLDWPLKISRLGGIPKFFCPPGQMSAVFDALTFIDQSTPPQLDGSKQVDFIRDIASVEELRLALCKYFNQSTSVDDDVPFEDEISDCCLTTVHQCVGRILAEFFYIEDK